MMPVVPVAGVMPAVPVVGAVDETPMVHPVPVMNAVPAHPPAVMAVREAAIAVRSRMPAGRTDPARRGSNAARLSRGGGEGEAESHHQRQKKNSKFHE